MYGKLTLVGSIGCALLLLNGRDISAQEGLNRNKAAVRHVFERVWNDAHFDSLTYVWSPNTQFHFRSDSSTVGADGVRRIVERWRTAFPDFEFVIEDIVAEGDRVAVRLTFTGTHSARFFGIDPTRRRIKVTEMMFFRLDNGRIVEAWEDYDEYGMRQQLAGSN